jgi:hypothetical protein
VGAGVGRDYGGEELTSERGLSMATATKKTLADRIAHLHPCSDAAKWLAEQKTPAPAWKDCQRGDWMMWILGKLSGEPGSDARKKLVLCACECARLALPHVKAGELRPLKAIETAEAWARGEASLDDVREARKAAYAAAAYAAYAAYAADAAAYAADAAAAAAYAAYAADAYADAAAYAAYAADAAAAAAYAAYAADAAAYAAAAYAARSKALATCAEIVRRHYPKPPKVGK